MRLQSGASFIPEKKTYKSEWFIYKNIRVNIYIYIYIYNTFYYLSN